MKKLTTVALKDNQYLVPQFHSSFVEIFCIGYTDGKRDKTIDGNYYEIELKAII